MRRVLPELVPILELVIEEGVESKAINQVHEAIGVSDERVKRLQAELEKADQQIQELTSALAKQHTETLKLKADRKAEENPSLPAAENAALRKKIKDLQAGILKDAEKMDRMETLLSMMVDWELPIFESWQTGKRNELINQKNDQAVYDQDVSN